MVKKFKILFFSGMAMVCPATSGAAIFLNTLSLAAGFYEFYLTGKALNQGEITPLQAGLHVALSLLLGFKNEHYFKAGHFLAGHGAPGSGRPLTHPVSVTKRLPNPRIQLDLPHPSTVRYPLVSLMTRTTNPTTRSSRRIESFEYQQRKPRFCDEHTNEPLKEKIAQYGDYLQHLVEKLFQLDQGYFGDEVRYGLCPEGAIGMHEATTTGGGGFYRLRGVYLEEEVVDHYHSARALFPLYPFLIGHELGHDLIDSPRWQSNWHPFLQTNYGRDSTYGHELEIDALATALLLGIPFEIPEHPTLTRRESVLTSLLALCQIEEERFRYFHQKGRLLEIIGEDVDPAENLTFKFARGVAKLDALSDLFDGYYRPGLTRDIQMHKGRTLAFLETFPRFRKRDYDEITHVFRMFYEEKYRERITWLERTVRGVELNEQKLDPALLDVAFPVPRPYSKIPQFFLGLWGLGNKRKKGERLLDHAREALEQEKVTNALGSLRTLARLASDNMAYELQSKVEGLIRELEPFEKRR